MYSIIYEDGYHVLVENNDTGKMITFTREEFDKWNKGE